MIYIGKTARHLRESIGLTQQELAEKLGITNVHLSNIENCKASPSQVLIDRYSELFDIDLYVLAWCRHGDVEKLPEAVRESARRLARAWEERLGEIIEHHRRTGDP
jgi:transcriptional regulator with XRE-family HTH domain